MMREKGFTLVELMVILAVIGIMAAIAIPTFGSMIRDRQAISLADDYYAAFGYARAEAVRSGSPIDVVPLKNNKWSEGLIVKEEDAAGSPGSGKQLRIVRGKKGLTITEKKSVVTVKYNGKGYITGLDASDSAVALSQGLQFDFCNGKLDAKTRQVRILTSGFAAVKSRGGC